ncbi:MAG: protein NO VEIN domain-containing protein [Candidatus Acidiferrales bacterium]
MRYDLRSEKQSLQEHVEVKGTQGKEVCFIITAAEVRNVMIDRDHVTCIVVDALSTESNMFKYSKEQFIADLDLEPIAFRARSRTPVVH